MSLLAYLSGFCFGVFWGFGFFLSNGKLVFRKMNSNFLWNFVYADKCLAQTQNVRLVTCLELHLSLNTVFVGHVRNSRNEVHVL